MGERHLDTGIALASIGIALFHQSKYDESIEASKTALEVYLEVLGPNHLLSVSIKRVAFAQRVLQSSPQGGLLNSSLKA